MIPKLILVTDRHRAHFPLPDLAQKAIAGGVDLIQIREKDLNHDDLAILITEILNAIGDPSKIAINGAPDLAAQFGIGLHLPESSPSPATARSIVDPNTLIGRSVHSPASAQSSDGADYLIAGHVFATSSKPGQPPLGNPGLRSIVASTPLPVIAIGGITANTLAPILATGAHGIAVITAINNSPDPYLAARTISGSLLQQAYLTERGDFSPARRLRSTHQETPPMSTPTTIDLTINGKPVTLDPGSTISTFLASKGLEERLVVVELNESIVPRTDYASTTLNTGDLVEIVHFVGGG